MPFLHTKSSKITFLTAENCISNIAVNIIKELQTVTNMYKARGFNIAVYNRNNKFNINAWKEHIRPENLNICAKWQHIPIIDRYIQNIKKVARCTIKSVPYKKCTRIMTISLEDCIIHSRNYFPQKVSISKRLGTNTILLGHLNPDLNMNIIFGSYAMFYIGETNTLKSRSIPSIALREWN